MGAELFDEKSVAMGVDGNNLTQIKGGERVQVAGYLWKEVIPNTSLTIDFPNWGHALLLLLLLLSEIKKTSIKS